ELRTILGEATPQSVEHFDLLSPCVRVCSASLTSCLEVRQKPRISYKTFGCGGSLRIGAWLKTHPHSWRRQPHDYVSIWPSRPRRAAKPTSGLGFPNRWTPAEILDWVRSAA